MFAADAVAEPARSYLADGRIVRWHPPDGRPWAIDAELLAQAVPATLARRTGVTDPARFWPQWTALETVCKLLDEPVLLRLRRLGLDGGRVDGSRVDGSRVDGSRTNGIRMWTRCHHGIVVTLGVNLRVPARASRHR